MKRIIDGFLILIKGMLLQDLKAVIATFLGAIIFYIIQMPISMLFGLFSSNYKNVSSLIMLLSFIIILPLIDIIFLKIGGTNKNIKIK